MVDYKTPAAWDQYISICRANESLVLFTIGCHLLCRVPRSFSFCSMFGVTRHGMSMENLDKKGISFMEQAVSLSSTNPASQFIMDLFIRSIDWSKLIDAVVMVFVNMTLHDLSIDVQAWTHQMSRFVNFDKIVGWTVKSANIFAETIADKNLELTWENHQQLCFVAETVIGALADFYVNLWACCWTAVQCFQRCLDKRRSIGDKTFGDKSFNRGAWESASRRHELYFATAFCGVHLLGFGLEHRCCPAPVKHSYDELCRQAAQWWKLVVNIVRDICKQ